ncbi:MAG: helix-turn-helix transcriptional regulator [Bdellovibrionaceae bacterium]|nr:helix-turn-helix transcriptional regulator [Pseudobdellovibrionaceae bacterium]
MTQMQVAQMLGYESVQFVSMIERGISNCPYQTLGSLSVILNIPKDKFVSLIMEEFKDHLSDSMNAGSKMIKATRNAG